MATLLAVLAFTYYWLSRFRLVIDSESIGYGSMLRPFKTIGRCEIKSIEGADVTGPFESPFTIVVTADSGNNLRINAKVFSWEAIETLLKKGK